MQSKLDTFTRAYLECALWSSDPDPGSGEWTESDWWCIDAIDPASLQRAIDDCAAFQRDNRADLDEVSNTFHADDTQHGHDFWLTRNGHGTGFWDRGYGALGRKLTDAAHVWGEINVFGPETDDQGSVSDDAFDAWDGVIHIE
jgi:hypothetical protein